MGWTLKPEPSEAGQGVRGERRGRTPARADQDCQSGGGWGKFISVLEVLIPGPVSVRWIVDVVSAANSLPKAGGDRAVKHAND